MAGSRRPCGAMAWWPTWYCRRSPPPQCHCRTGDLRRQRLLPLIDPSTSPTRLTSFTIVRTPSATCAILAVYSPRVPAAQRSHLSQLHRLGLAVRARRAGQSPLRRPFGVPLSARMGVVPDTRIEEGFAIKSSRASRGLRNAATATLVRESSAFRRAVEAGMTLAAARKLTSGFEKGPRLVGD